MRLPSLAFFTVLLSTFPLSAQLPGGGPSESSPKAEALDLLLSERESEKGFQDAIADARKKGVSEQAILEARFLFHIDRNEDEAVAAMLPDFLKAAASFKISESETFGTTDDWLAVVEYVKAIDALVKTDNDAFKKHVTEAFWLSPRQGAAFAPHIDRLRLAEAMRTVKIDFTLKLAPAKSGDPVALDSLLAGKKAMLFHFWSPFSRECEESMPDFAASAAFLKEKIAVVSLLPEDSPKILTDARALIEPLGDGAGSWLIDSKEHPLGRELRVRNLPTMVLVSPEGKVLFNGHPVEDGLWNALETIDPSLTRPRSAEAEEQR